MRLKIFLLFGFFAVSITLTGQKSPAIYCKSFTKNNKIYEGEEKFRLIIENILQSISNPAVTVERKKISEIFEVLEEEKNIKVDIDNEVLKELKSTSVDFIFFGNFDYNEFTLNLEFQSKCVKISGDNALESIVFAPIRFTVNEFESTEIFEEKVKDLFEEYSFTNDYGIIKTDTLIKFNREISSRDVQIEQLKEHTAAILKYSDISRLNLYGHEWYIPKEGSPVSVSSSIIDSMAVVFKFDENRTHEIQQTERALNAAKAVISFNERFPFSYYAIAVILREREDEDWKEYSKRATDIFYHTTLFDGCNPAHKVCLSTCLKEIRHTKSI